MKALWHAVDTYNPAMSRLVSEIICQEMPDVVHTNNIAGFSPSIWKAVRQRRIPLVHTLRDYYLLCPKTTMFRYERNCNGRCLNCYPYSVNRQRQSQLVDALVGISHFILNKHLAFGYFRNAIHRSVIHNSYEASTGEGSGWLGEPSFPLKLGYLGRLAPSKGIELVLEAVSRFPTGSIELQVAGKGDSGYVEHLKGKYHSTNIRFLGFMEPEELFGEIELLVVPSLWHEPMGRVVIEAYAHGVPVIASNRGGIPEIVDDGETGYIFDPTSIRALTSAIKTVLDSPQVLVDMREKCRRKASEYLPARITDAYLGIYARVAGTGSHEEA
jgi:glycosyltransferase involved in cell wall biosynthesis